MPEERKFVEKRNGPDMLVKAIKWAVVIGWIIIIAIIIVIGKAQPPQENFIDRLFKVQQRTTWDSSLMFFVFCLMVLLYTLCIIGFIFNIRRSKRKSDRFSISLILLGLISFIGMILYVLSTR